LAKKANPDKVLKYLYKNTFLQYHYGINFTMLDNGRFPRVFGWKEMLQSHIDHERVVYRRGYEFDLKKAENRTHILDGFLICFARIDEVINTIKSSPSSAMAKEALCKNFLLDEIQAKAILDMKLSRLARLEVEKIQKEYDELQVQIKWLKDVLSNEELLKEEIKKGWKEVAAKFGDSRRTKIINIVKEDEEPTEIRQLQVSLTNHNNLFVAESSSLYTQRRGTVGNKLKLASGEYVISSHTATSNEDILLFTNSGNVYACSAYSLTIGEKICIPTICQIKDWEVVVAITSTSKKDTSPYIYFLTKRGIIKKSELSEYNLTRKTGLKAINLDEGDEITSVLFGGDTKIGILTEFGNFLMIETSSIRPIGRAARGVRAIKLSDGDGVSNARIIPTDTRFIASISGGGLFKKTPIDEFVVQGRDTKGNKIQKVTDGDFMADFCPITTENEVLIASTNACLKLTINDIPIFSKGAMGNKSIKLNAKDNVIGISVY
jgi:DNA gyrase subunit A